MVVLDYEIAFDFSWHKSSGWKLSYYLSSFAAINPIAMSAIDSSLWELPHYSSFEAYFLSYFHLAILMLSLMLSKNSKMVDY